METGEYVFDIPRNLGSQTTAIILAKNPSVVDKLEQAYFSKGFM